MSPLFQVLLLTFHSVGRCWDKTHRTVGVLQPVGHFSSIVNIFMDSMMSFDAIQALLPFGICVKFARGNLCFFLFLHVHEYCLAFFKLKAKSVENLHN
jgi:hypothetical protein